jgi:DNA-binding Lrp family transcriptional regulator
MDLKVEIENFQDYLAPKLDTYEQAIYLYIFRHGRLQGKEEVSIGFKSARKKIALGIGESGMHISESTCYKKLRSLESKGCIKIIGTVYGGTKIRLNLPSEIKGVISSDKTESPVSLEEMDFFTAPENRLAILRRESYRCFYCLCTLNTSNHVIEHVISRPHGDNTYRNLVAACVSCNNRKGNRLADEFLRSLYRDGYLNPEDFESRLSALQLLRSGELRPILGNGELN